MHFNSSMSILCIAPYEFQKNFFRPSNLFYFFTTSSGNPKIENNYQYLTGLSLYTNNYLYSHLINTPLPQVSGWLSRLKPLPSAQVMISGSGIEPRIGLSAQQGNCFPLFLCLPLCLLVASVCQINK